MTELTQTVILIRHGDTVDENVDSDRPLSEVGQRQAATTGAWLTRAGVSVDEIRHSGKLRARETAELVGVALGMTPERIRSVRGLAPKDEVGEIAAGLRAEGSSVAIVGHLPHVARLASLLLAGEQDRMETEFSPGAAMVLGRDGGAWHLLRFERPDEG